MSIHVSSLQQGIKACLEHTGLGFLTLNLIEKPRIHPDAKFLVGLDYEFEIPYGTNTDKFGEWFEDFEFRKKLIEGIKGSKLVERELASLKTEIEDLKKELEHYKAQANDRYPYKVHYELEMKLRHGEKP